MLTSPTVAESFGTDADLLAAIASCVDNEWYFDAAEGAQWFAERDARDANATRLRDLRAEATRRGLSL